MIKLLSFIHNNSCADNIRAILEVGSIATRTKAVTSSSAFVSVYFQNTRGPKDRTFIHLRGYDAETADELIFNSEFTIRLCTFSLNYSDTRASNNATDVFALVADIVVHIERECVGCIRTKAD